MAAAALGRLSSTRWLPGIAGAAPVSVAGVAEASEWFEDPFPVGSGMPGPSSAMLMRRRLAPDPARPGGAGAAPVDARRIGLVPLGHHDGRTPEVDSPAVTVSSTG
ncbi:hypothetical protein Ahu01nite_075690 [Winogradskya humida]|uniref:Uncharacterized protein n=1 Tax=Winogradskya humida TaxID=113566 RepID=A0ABQ4A0V4_9ACTN|nr:hypothetical protein Ahu01nite_075690 [Actinoplanes humidus]